jgi:hypothetical protein
MRRRLTLRARCVAKLEPVQHHRGCQRRYRQPGQRLPPRQIVHAEQEARQRGERVADDQSRQLPDKMHRLLNAILGLQFVCRVGGTGRLGYGGSVVDGAWCSLHGGCILVHGRELPEQKGALRHLGFIGVWEVSKEFHGSSEEWFQSSYASNASGAGSAGSDKDVTGAWSRWTRAQPSGGNPP